MLFEKLREMHKYGQACTNLEENCHADEALPKIFEVLDLYEEALMVAGALPVSTQSRKVIDEALKRAKELAGE